MSTLENIYTHVYIRKEKLWFDIYPFSNGFLMNVTNQNHNGLPFLEPTKSTWSSSGFLENCLPKFCHPPGS